MFAVVFEVQPRSDKWDDYLGLAQLLKPELQAIDGFIDVTRYHSLARPGWLLSLSIWRDEKALVRWRTQAKHHGAQERGRSEIFGDYHLRVGQITRDTAEADLPEQRLDETAVGAGTTVTLVSGKRPPEWVKQNGAQAVAADLGLKPEAAGLVAWDVFDAVLAPGEVILLLSWRDQAAAEAFEAARSGPDAGWLRRVRIVRDYGMFDRREAPQYYPDAARR
ncbi:antibiotic biosynthesis monooxygenase family protein [Dongia sp.]|uniref:antibiotic biosynthesis monooxygenase family protein n=1 Tax=Dongia sp. TaxID=1977262 RepID=UPI0037509F91